MPDRTTRRITTFAATLTIAAIFAAGCQSSGQQPQPTTTPPTPTTTTTPPPPPTTTAPPTSPTEKSIDPTGGNLFTPQVIAPAAPTEPPGVHRNHKH
ncbi:hypothetical protein M1247_25010 [Mycobacterium sp. 21AC1]|uniref:hypothetical protein n=1 Tax=[Mycobacterium] appelbergii TaxID=2939269 RepID=UPI0029390074|nr:hypothetical protein [Mycobacterium sp. 21AC1]MDV3128197.1 hypothetical protein [Mycobacterium sp. 21AC1]